jgi:hypothetical protein
VVGRRRKIEIEGLDKHTELFEVVRDHQDGLKLGLSMDERTRWRLEVHTKNMLFELRNMRMILRDNRTSEAMLQFCKALEPIRDNNEFVGLQNMRCFLTKLLVYRKDVGVKAVGVRATPLTLAGF